MLNSRTMGSVRRSNWRRIIPFLALNVLVSACTVLVVLAFWNRASKPASPTPMPTMDTAAIVASAIPTPTETLPPSPTPRLYTVQPGDSLYAIALELDIPMEAIMAANGISDPGKLAVGQDLIIPSDDTIAAYEKGLVTPAGSFEADETATPEVEAPRVEIAGIDGEPGDLETEAVRVLNSGGVAHLAGWKLDDGEGHVYIFPDFTLYSGAVSVYTHTGQDTVIDLYWGLDEAVWFAGKTITLRDPNGRVQSTFRIP